MKIGIVCYPTYGGSGVVATELGKALGREGHEVHFVTYQQPARLDYFQPNVLYHEVNLANYPLFEYPPYETALASKLVDVVQHSQLDLIHVHYAIPHASAALMAKRILAKRGIHIPVVTTLHGTDITLVGNNETYAPVVTYSINESDGVTAVSESLKQDTLNFFEIETEIRVIPNFIDLTTFKKENKDHFRTAIAPDGEKILIHVSNFRKVKRVQDIIKMFHIVKEKVPVKLLLIGDGPERIPIEKMARELCVDCDIRFLGKQDAVGELLAVADLFILPSEKESFGLAALEAMACEVPVISSDAGGIPEVNIDGVTGYTSKVEDVESMAANAIELLSNEEKLKAFRANALKKASEFDLRNVLPIYVNYYEEVIERMMESIQ